MTTSSTKGSPIIASGRFMARHPSTERVPPAIPIQFSKGAGENTFHETHHVSPSKLSKLMGHPALEKMYAVDSLNSVHKDYRCELENIMAHEPNDSRCICKICTCGFHHCPTRNVRYKFPGLMNSSYIKDFQGSPTVPVYQFNHDKDKPKFFGDDRVDDKSAYQHFYVPHPVEYSPQQSLKPGLDKQPFINSSSYLQHYPNWGVGFKNVSRKEYSPYRPIHYDIKTNYQETYTPIDLNYRAMPLPKKDNFPLEQKFDHSTTYKNEYVNFNRGRPEIVLPKQSPVRNQAFPGQFQSLSNKDFPKKKIDECEIKKFEGIHDVLVRSSLYYNPMRSQYYY